MKYTDILPSNNPISRGVLHVDVVCCELCGADKDDCDAILRGTIRWRWYKTSETLDFEKSGRLCFYCHQTWRKHFKHLHTLVKVEDYVSNVNADEDVRKYFLHMRESIVSGYTIKSERLASNLGGSRRVRSTRTQP